MNKFNRNNFRGEEYSSMFYYTPKVAIGEFLPKQTQLEDKFGGLPWGLPQEYWPICEDCGYPIVFLAQFCHHPERLPLGKEGRVLYLFACQDGCDICEWNDGGTAVVIIEADELTDGLTEPPFLPEPSRFGTRFEILSEARVIEWERHQEGLADQEGWKCFDEEEWCELELDLSPDDISHETKLGGFPNWLHRPIIPPHSYRFVGQYNTGPSYFKDPDHVVDALDENGLLRYNFGGNSNCIGFLFVDPDPVRPKGKLVFDVY
jgi:hypothetical protein